MYVCNHGAGGRRRKKRLARIAERGAFKTFIETQYDVPKIPWVDWLRLAIRELHMRPDDFWALSFPTARDVICGKHEDTDMTRKELLEGEREFNRRMACLNK